MTVDEQRALVAEAALGPSVHNVQPARWRFDDGGVVLWEDTTRRLPAGDPEGRDAAMSLGAAAEGMALALSGAGRRLVDLGAERLPAVKGALQPYRRFGIVPSGEADPLRSHVATRQSYRGAFAKGKVDTTTLAAEDCAVVADPARIAAVAAQVDRSGHRFFRDPGFRAELLSWMRLRRGDPRWPVDGLNAEAMAMSRVEAFGAGLVMGPLFAPLDRVGLAAALTSEAATIRSAAAILLFHRKDGEPRFESGRAFYRLWLHIEAAGLRAAVMASLADDAAGRASVADLVPPGRTLVSALRVGRAPPRGDYPCARIAVDGLIV